MARILFATLALTVGLLPRSVGAAPIARPADLSLTVSIPGFGLLEPVFPYGYVSLPSAFGSTSVQVDDLAGSIRFAADALALTTPFVAIEDGTTALSSVTMTRLGNLSATFSVGGASGIAGEPPCPLAGVGACVDQGGFGGVMGVTGTLYLHIVPHNVVIPLQYGAFGIGLGGPLDTAPFTTDPAPWTIGVGAVQHGGTGLTSPFTAAGSATGSTLRLVSPTYVQALGNVFPITATLEITFTDGLGLPGFVFDTVPEPAPILLCAIVATGAALRARRARRRNR